MKRDSTSPEPSARTHTPSARATRKSKPIMEKRRRARINQSLAHLKALILHELHADVSRHSKLEKAEILELTVKLLRSEQRAAAVPLTLQQGALGRFSAGFSACMSEVIRFMSTCEGTSCELGVRLLSHLARCMMMAPPPPRTLQIAMMTEVALKARPTLQALETEELQSRFRPADIGRASSLVTLQEPSGTAVWRPW